LADLAVLGTFCLFCAAFWLFFSGQKMTSSGIFLGFLTLVFRKIFSFYFLFFKFYS